MQHQVALQNQVAMHNQVAMLKEELLVMWAMRPPKGEGAWYTLVQAAEDFCGTGGTFSAHMSTWIVGTALPQFRISQERKGLKACHGMFQNPHNACLESEREELQP